MKKLLIVLSITLLWSVTSTAQAAVGLDSAATSTCGSDTICLFQNTLPFLAGSSDWDFEDYVNGFFNIAISLAAILVVFRLIMAGIKYMFSEVITSKGKAKEDMLNAIIGLLIILGAITILKTINPQILNISVLSNLPDIAETQTHTPTANPERTDPCATNPSLASCNTTGLTDYDSYNQWANTNCGGVTNVERAPDGSLRCAAEDSTPTTGYDWEVTDGTIVTNLNRRCQGGSCTVVFHASNAASEVQAECDRQEGDLETSTIGGVSYWSCVK